MRGFLFRLERGGPSPDPGERPLDRWRPSALACAEEGDELLEEPEGDDMARGEGEGKEPPGAEGLRPSAPNPNRATLLRLQELSPDRTMVARIWLQAGRGESSCLWTMATRPPGRIWPSAGGEGQVTGRGPAPLNPPDQRPRPDLKAAG